ncbi:MAG: DEAD/DEAH box helicase [Desulfobacterales bacterium]|nr:DEAD/DEAH box helicase [Desulfobacterales bacterium]
MNQIACKITLIETRPATYKELSKLIDSSDEWAVGALVRLYQFQTRDEQQAHRTNHLNECGFNSFDAGVLSDIAEFYQNKGFLTPRQLAFIKNALKKYINQLLRVGVQPLPLKPFIPTQQKETHMTASLLTKEDKPSGVQVRFNFPKGDSRFGDTLAKVKTLPNRRWIAEEKYWRVALSLEAGEKLKEWGFQFSEDLQRWFGDLIKPVDEDIVDMSQLDSRLYPFQKTGIAFIESRKGRALIGDEMGLGKTAQAISWLKLHAELRPVIVVCPASLKINWERELRLWGLEKEKIQIVSGKKNGFALTGQIIIINYDILTPWLDALEAYKPKVVILDEVHYTKSRKAQRTKAAKSLAKKAPHVIALSGTPIVNRPMEFFNSINMIRPDVFPDFWGFAQKFCGAKWNGFGWDFTGATNTDKLHKLLTETIMLRRLKKDVLKDLPDKILSIVPFEIENRDEYNRAAANIIDWILKNEGKEKADRASQAEFLVEFEKLKQLAVRGKIESVKEWVADFLESGEKLVLFATHILTLDLLQQAFPKISVRLDGSTSQKGRQEAVDRFQNDDGIRLFLGNIKAAGIGITLTAASNVGFVELPWTPGDYEQAPGRLHRIGQKNAVNVWILVAQDTVEEDIAVILSEKQKVLAAVLDGKQVDESTVLSLLIQKTKGERKS